MPARPDDARAFHALHQTFLILPNAWDAASARMMQAAGAKAVATSSAAVAWAQGYADGNHLPIARLADAVAAIARGVTLPITADAEAGYADDPARVGENIAALIGAGAVGINLEDGKGEPALHLRKIEAARSAAERAGVDLYINARTDVYLKRLVPKEQMLEETLRRVRAFKGAGASGVFVPALSQPAEIEAVVAAAELPLNLMSLPTLAPAAALEALGVRRLSAATAVFHAAMEAARATAAAFLADGDSAALWARRGEPPDYNALFAP